jgi:hypothetical protein
MRKKILMRKKPVPSLVVVVVGCREGGGDVALSHRDGGDFGIDVVDGVRRLDFQSDGLACQCLDKDLHPTTEVENKMEG